MSGISDKATVTLQVNGTQAKQMMADIENKIKSTEQAIIRLKKSNADPKDVEKQRKLLKTYTKQLEEMRSATEGVSKAFKSLDTATPRQLEKTLKTLNKQIKDLKPGSAAWDEHTHKIQQVTAQLKVLKQQIQGLESLWQRFSKWWFQCGQAVAALVMGYQQLISTLRGYVNDYAAMEEEMADTMKFTGLTKQGVDELNKSFKAMDTRTPREKLNELAQEAGRLGKKTVEDVAGYVRAADITNVALSELGEGATETISKISNIFNIEAEFGTEDAILKVGSTVNELAQNCSATSNYIVEFTKRMAGVGSQANMTVQEIMSLGAVLDATGQQVEMSASAVSRTVMMLFQKPAKIAKTVGLNVEEFTKTLKRNTTEGLMMFFQALSRFSHDDALAALAPIFKDLGMDGVRMSNVLAVLAGNIDLVREKIIEADVAFADGKSTRNEFEVFNNTAQAKIEKAKKKIHELSVELGGKLFPLMAHIASTASASLKVLNELVDFIIKYKREIVALCVSIAAYTVVVKAAWAASKAWGIVTTAVTTIAKTARVAVMALRIGYLQLTNQISKAETMTKLFNRTTKASPMGIFTALVIGAAGAVYSLSARMKDAKAEAERARKELHEFKESVVNIDAASADYSSKEITRLKALYEEATNEALATDKRRVASEKLQNLYPDYFKSLSIEQIMVGQAKQQYDNLTASIIEAARARAAAAKIEENEKLILELEGKQSSLQTQQSSQKYIVQTRQQELDAVYSRNNKDIHGAALGDSREMKATNVQAKIHEINTAQGNLKVAQDALSATAKELYAVNSQLIALNEANNSLAEKYKISSEAFIVSDEFTFNEGDGDIDSHDRFTAEKEWREREEALNRIAYAKGERDYIAYTKRMDEIAVEFYNKQLQHTDLTESERFSIEAQYWEAVKKGEQDLSSFTAEEMKAAYNAEIAVAKQHYIDGEYSYETYTEALERLELTHLEAMATFYKEGTKERLQAESDLQNALIAQRQRNRQALEAQEAKFAAMKKDYFGDNPQEAQAKFDADLAMLDVVYEREIAAAGNNADEKLRIDEAYEKAKLVLKKKYGLLAEEDTRNAMEKGIADSVEWLKSDGGKALTGTLDTLVSGMSSVFSQLSSLMQSELEIQTAEITNRYDAEIQAAQGNTYKIAKLEKKKDAEIAKAKNEANRKMFAMQVIQAVAQTAQNALAAYGSAAQIPMVGLSLAPIAAAMAVAAGAIQIAAIKKQQQASEAKGYAEGGFTKPGSKYEPAGIVHAGEWVASQKLLANPGARALIEQLDYVQRTNTIGSLKSEDVSMAITAPQSLTRIMEGDASSALVVAAVAKSAEAVKELSERLKEPIAAITTVTGEYGINRAQEEYAALLRNITSKAKYK